MIKNNGFGATGVINNGGISGHHKNRDNSDNKNQNIINKKINNNSIKKNNTPNKKIMNIMDNKNGGINRNIVFLTVVFIIMAVGVVAQQLPTLISLQGKLTNTTTGATIVTADLRVNISDTSGVTVWNETFLSGVSNGFFDLLLGSNVNNPLNLSFNQDYNISIYVGSTSGAQIGGTYRFRSGVGGIAPSNITAGNFSAPGNFTLGEVFVDKTNGRIGIGATTTPNDILEVIGNVRISGSINATNLNTTGQTILASVSGNVGIGMTTPTEALVVAGNTNVTQSLFVGTDASNSEMGQGITIDQGVNDNEILSFKSSDVAHGITSQTETDTFGTITKTSDPFGGLRLWGFAESTFGVILSGVVTSENTLKASNAVAPVTLQGYTKSGTSVANPGADANLVIVRQGTDTTVWLADVEGDTWQSGNGIFGGSINASTGLNVTKGDTLLGTTSGNVGIGTTAPTKVLSVNGTLNALTVDPSATDPTINTTGQNITIASSSGSVIIQLG